MKSFRFISLFFLLLVVLSCSDYRVRHQLKDIASYIENRPDSAIVALKLIPRTGLRTNALRAEYSMLYAMALDKNYIDTTDVSIIHPAVLYYGRHGSANERLKAYYYEGIAYFNKGEYDNAIVSFSSAEELIPLVTDMQYVGLLYSRLSDLYNRTFNSEAELRYIERAEVIFDASNLDKYKYTTIERKGQALANSRRYDDAERIFLELLATPSIPDNLRRLTKEDYAVVLVSKPNRDSYKALTLFSEVLGECGTLRDIVSWSAYAFTLSACGFSTESEQLFQQLYNLESRDYSIVDIWESEAYKEKGDLNNAFRLLQKSLAYQDSLVNIKLSQATARAQVEHIALKNSQLQIESKNNQLKSILTISAFILISLAMYFLYEAKKRKLKRERLELIDIAETMKFRLRESEDYRFLDKCSFESEIQSKDSELLSLRKEIDSKEEILSALRSEYARMYKSQFKYLGNLCEAFFVANERTDSQRFIYNKVKSMIRDINGDKAGQKRFEKKIDSTLDNLMSHFRKEFPGYSEDDYRFVSYLFVGFDATTLSIVLNMPSTASVYMKKSRIKKTIQESSARYKDEYLEMLA